MGKIKKTELLENESITDSVKEGKIKKKKDKKQKKLKDVVKKTDAEELAPQLDSNTIVATTEKSKKKKNKNKITEATTENNQEAAVSKKNKQELKVANEIQEQQNQKKSKKNKAKKEKSAQSPTKESKDVTETDVKKIERKKAKKLAQKLKKQKKIEEKQNDPNKTVETTSSNGDLKEKKKKKKKDKPAGENATETETPDSANSKVVSKKDRKAKRRQLLKEQRLAEKQTPRDPAVEAATIFVGNLPVNTKRIQILRLFKEYGPINSIRIRSAGGKVLHKHKQRKEAGTLNAYIVLKSKATAEKAISLNGVEFKGHHLRVTSSMKNPVTHEKEEAKKTVFVGNLKYSATEEALREIFTSCGEIEYIRCIRDGDKGCKGVAYVCFKTADAVGLALELNQTILDERPINVERFSVKKLGAKDAREAQAEKDAKSKKGAKQRIDGKKSKKDKSGGNKSTSNKNNDDDAKKPKKNEFKGVKFDALKKKQKQKKKKSNNQMLQLAKKIAPKSLNE